MNKIIHLLAEIEIEIDGDLDKQKAIEYLSEVRCPEGIISEDYDGTEDWAILVNKWTVKEK